MTADCAFLSNSNLKAIFDDVVKIDYLVIISSISFCIFTVLVRLDCIVTSLKVKQNCF